MPSRWVKPGAAEGVTTGDAFDAAPCSAERPVFFNRFDHILAARGVVSAHAAHDVSQGRAIAQHQKYQHLGQQANKHLHSLGGNAAWGKIRTGLQVLIRRPLCCLLFPRKKFPLRWWGPEGEEGEGSGLVLRPEPGDMAHLASNVFASLLRHAAAAIIP